MNKIYLKINNFNLYILDNTNTKVHLFSEFALLAGDFYSNRKSIVSAEKYFFY
jgi:hypothetical protein